MGMEETGEKKASSAVIIFRERNRKFSGPVRGPKIFFWGIVCTIKFNVYTILRGGNTQNERKELDRYTQKEYT